MKFCFKNFLIGPPVWLTVFYFCFATEVPAVNPPAIQSLAKGVSIFCLDNGLQVLLIANSALPMTGVNVVVKTGSAYETFSTSGMSHMLEHLLFNGTASRTQKELYDAVDLIGGYNNANTGSFYTNYMMVTPAENIGKGMEIQADMLFHSELPEDKFEKEKGIVLEEIARSLENNDEQLWRNEQNILYPGHALSLPTLGTYSTIAAMNRDAVYDYYKNAYVPNNMLMSVVGNFNSDSMRTMIKQIYGSEIPNRVQSNDDRNWRTGFQNGPEITALNGKVFYRFYNGEKTILQQYYQLPQDWQDVHFVIAEEIFSKQRSDMVDFLKEFYPETGQSLKLEIHSSPLKNYLKITLSAEKNTNLTLLSNKIDQAVRKLIFKPADETLDFLSTRSKTAFFQNIEKPHMFGIYNAHIFAERGIEAVLSSYQREAYKMAAADLATYSINGEALVLIQLPFKSSDVKSTGPDTDGAKRVDYENGLVLIAGQNANSELLAVHFLLKYKAQYDARFGKDAAKILHDCLGERLNSIENQKISNQFGLSFTVNDNPFIPMDNIYLDPDFGYIRVEGLADDIPGVISYIRDQIGNFKPTQEEYQQVLSKSKMPNMGMGSSQANAIFDQAWEKQVYEADKYPVNQQAVSFDSLINMAALYLDPSNMIISVVSPAGSDEIFNLFSWGEVPVPVQSRTIEKTPSVRRLKSAESEFSEELNGGGERSFLFWGFVSPFEKNEQAALQALGLLLSDHIIFEIREKQGRAYRMKAGIEMVAQKALFYINLGTRPDNIDPLISQAPDFFTLKTIDSFNEFDLQKSINMYLGRMMFRRLSSINRAFYLGYSAYFQNDIEFDAKFLADLSNITMADVKRVAEKYLEVKNPQTIIVR